MVRRTRDYSWPSQLFAAIGGAAIFGFIVSASAIPAFAMGVEKTVHVFTGSPDGTYPVAGISADRFGNLFGTTASGGDFGYGSVFELTPDAKGGYAYKVVYSLTGGSDGAFPQATVAIDAHEHLYGTTIEDDIDGDGTVFELVPDKAGNYRLGKTFYFDGTDGSKPSDALTLDAAGDVFGTTSGGGGPGGYGQVFELPASRDQWSIQTVYAFKGGYDGQGPVGGVIIDANDDFYGTTVSGGNVPYGGGIGTVFRLHEGAAGWIKTTLHSFRPEEGSNPESTLSMDSSGNLYGTTIGSLYRGQKRFVGSVFEVKRPKSPSDSRAHWPLTTLHAFTGGGDGEGPGQIVLDRAGAVYGVTGVGGNSTRGTGNNQGCPTGCGVIYELMPRPDGTWYDNVLWNFHGGMGGQGGIGPIAFGNDGRLYGTTDYGGRNDYPTANGIIFSYAK